MAWIFTNHTQFYLHDGETLLAGMLRVGIKAHHQCGEGYCGTCKIKHRYLRDDSQVHYHTEPLVMLADDELLPCCCHIVGAVHLVIDTPEQLINNLAQLSKTENQSFG